MINGKIASYVTEATTAFIRCWFITIKETSYTYNSDYLYIFWYLLSVPMADSHRGFESICASWVNNSLFEGIFYLTPNF